MYIVSQDKNIITEFDSLEIKDIGHYNTQGNYDIVATYKDKEFVVGSYKDASKAVKEILRTAEAIDNQFSVYHIQ